MKLAILTSIVVLLSLLLIVIITIATFIIFKKHKKKLKSIKNYGTCEYSDNIPLQITITKPNDEDICSDNNNIMLQDDRRCTMPCILPSSTGSLHAFSESVSSLCESSVSSVSSNHLLLSGLISPARRYSDNSNSQSSTELRKRSVRPDRFSILSLNLDLVINDQNEFSSYEVLNLYGQGKLSFSLVYNESISRFYVTINKAVYLNSSKVNNLAGFYVKVYLLNKENDMKLQMHKSEIVTANKSPMFEQTFSFLITKSFLNCVKLKFQVKQFHNGMNKNELLGGFLFYLNNTEILRNPELFQELWRDLYGDLRKDIRLGEVLFSLMYSENQSSTLLSINLHRAKNLQIRQHDNSVFTRCTILIGNKPIKTKRSVTVKKDIVSPYFDLESIFNLEKSNIMEIGVVIHVCSRSKIGFSHLLGKVVLGSVVYTDDKSVLTHWKDMINYPNRSITKWHRII